MIHSMTGYGKSVEDLHKKTISIEVNSGTSQALNLNKETTAVHRVNRLSCRRIEGHDIDGGTVA